MDVFVKVLDTTGVETRGSTNDAVNLVAFAEKELSEVGTILTGDT